MHINAKPVFHDLLFSRDQDKANSFVWWPQSQK